MQKTFKRCSNCGREYTRAEWAALPYKGPVMLIAADSAGPAMACECKDCRCKGTMTADLLAQVAS